MSTRAETSYGTVAGWSDGEVVVFRGIPYARPPVGPLRFRPPQPPAPWAGVRETAQFASAASQNPSLLGPVFGFDMGPSSEDCLYLNIWTPAADREKRPVLVWIHGGGFTIGSGSQPLYDGAVLAQRGDVVVVTINYRLGAFGFLRLADVSDGVLSGSGNEGLLDQIAALEWVRDEIAAFGGDSQNVTVFGESAGSISVATLLGTPRAHGLFRRAILQSGSANLVSSPAQAQEVTETVLRELGLTARSAGTLQDVPAAKLLAAQQQAFLKLQSRVRGLTYAPVVDGDILPRHPFAAIADGLSRDVPVLVGTNLDEWKLFGLTDPQARTLDDAALIRRCERNMPGPAPERPGRAREIVATYREARAARGLPADAPDLWFAIESDRVFRYPAMRLVELQSAHQAQVSAYLFTWPSPFMEGILGACHALEIPFVFGSLRDPLIGTLVGPGPAATRLAEYMQEAWLTFARGGTPGRDWPTYSPAQRATMVLGAESAVEHRPFEPERRFWDFWDGTL